VVRILGVQADEQWIRLRAIVVFGKVERVGLLGAVDGGGEGEIARLGGCGDGKQ